MPGIVKATLISLLTVCACLCLEGAKVNVVQFGSIKISTSFEAAPQVLRNASTGNAYASGGVSFTNKRWLAVHVSFVPGIVDAKQINKKQGNVKTVTGIPGRWLDGPVMRVWLAFPALKNRGQIIYGLFEGQTNFWTMRLDGKRHSAVMFIPPQLLDRYAAQTGARKEMQLSLSSCRVLVEFTDSKGTVLGCSTHNAGNKFDSAFAFFETLRNTPGITRIKNAVLPRNKTPWAWHMSTTFDYIKDTGNDDNGSGKQ